MTTPKTETQPKADSNGNAGNKPDYYVHAVVPQGRGTRIGGRLGVVFNHKNGEGFTIYLDANPIPVNGQIELVAYVPKP
ncbi:MAG: hypothetical protein H6577_10000 [Lewinellaceae bacterium]|nr:hypothetical protein [Saprospiraceae bacterium]MCB9338449.1 hypothetical protein [Lewinellaceae bacterium]